MSDTNIIPDIWIDGDECECGNPALVDEDGFVTSVNNGMYHLPVCGDCWRDPEVVAMEVHVDLCSVVVGRPAWSALSPEEERAAVALLVDHLAIREIDGTDPDIFNKYMTVVAAEWDNGYAAS